MFNKVKNENNLEINTSYLENEIHELNQTILKLKNELSKKDDILKTEIELQFEMSQEEFLKIQGQNRELQKKLDSLNE
jgi:hypothetical protein